MLSGGIMAAGVLSIDSLPAAQPPPALLRTLPSLPLSLCLSLGALCFENVACSHALEPLTAHGVFAAPRRQQRRRRLL